MQSITLSPSTALTGLVLILALAISDGMLVHAFREQRAVLDSFANRQAQTLPAVGEGLPTLSGRKLTTGEDFSVVPASTELMTLLVFRESCQYCEQNWKNWETLYNTPSNKMPIVFISGDSAVSASYRQKHPLLDGHIALVGIKPEILASLKLGATPQTVLVVDGKVKRGWPGVLTDDDIKEVKQAASDELARHD
jgi:hypothetical protein